MQPCSAAEAEKRQHDAHEFLEVATKVAGQDAGVSGANAVLAGIAAADAACCKALAERSRGQDHRDAIGLIAQVEPGGRQTSIALRRLLAIKNDAEYGLKPLSTGDQEAALRQARKLIEFATVVLAR